MKNNQKGITLVALVITIIVLLILAGVTIAALSGENGILSRASEASVKTKVADAKEIITNSYNAAVADYYNAKYVNGTTVNDAAAHVIGVMDADTDLDNYSGVTITVTPGTKTVAFTVDGTTYTGTVANETSGTTLSWDK